MNIVSATCICGDIQETGKSLASKQARKTREASAKEAFDLQMSRQRKHHCRKILDPTKEDHERNSIVNITAHC